jgi:ATP-binding cassette subfamily F protein uup
LLNLLDVSLHFGGPAILEKINFQVDAGERVGLLGRNGAGKSTLMKVIMGDMKPDTGDVFRPSGAVYRRLTQEIPTDLTGTVHDIVASGLRPNDDHHEEEWERDVRVEDLINAIRLPPAQEFSALSGGLKRRALLARALAAQPDLLLLDEPTNHLDLESILWLEEFLLEKKPTLLFVTHDRAFLRKSPRASWSSTAAASPAGPATTTPTSSASRKCSRPRSGNAPSSTRNWRRRRSGSAAA